MAKVIVLFFALVFVILPIKENRFPKNCKPAHYRNAYFTQEGMNFKVIIEYFGEIQYSHRLYKKYYMKLRKTWNSSCVYTTEILETHDPYLVGQKGMIDTYQITNITDSYYDFFNINKPERKGRVYFLDSLDDMIEQQRKEFQE
ncbi:MAG: hypothetical protein SFU98_05720 [Leptospiraceae bacterium]|nr:hypothetical protein [Leptospiraceae bacterium]